MNSASNILTSRTIVRPRLGLRLFFLSQYILLAIVLTLFSPYVEDHSLLTNIYLVADLLSYPLFYLLPGMLLTWAVCTLPVAGKPGLMPLRRTVSIVVAYLASTLTLLLIFSDYELYQLYEYHFDAFVWNLLTTPGGIASLGTTLSTKISYGVMVIGLGVINLSLLVFTLKLGARMPGLIPRGLIYGYWMAATMMLLVGGEATYAYAHYMRIENIPQAASVIPFHMHTTSKSTFEKMGFVKQAEHEVRIAHGVVHYPLEKIHFDKPEKPLNIVWLVAESLRWDMLDPEIMPNLSKFSERSLRFKNHYSGGNRTRMGMFSMFYGLYAPYWYAFQEQRIGPVLMDVMNEQGYQMAIHTSQSFSYPELKDTVFAQAPKDSLHELSRGAPSWQRDEQNITEILQFIDRSDTDKPFFSFMFFEATHAPYEFSLQDSIRKNYLENMNYARISGTNDPEPLKNRYINAAHSVDRQLGRLFHHLEQRGLLDNTIVLFTGDHGEEFMEKGHWGHGHNAKFPEEQIRVPLVLHLPGYKPDEISQVTSHLDIVGTLLPMLGVTTETEKFSMGGDLLENPGKDFVVGNYNYAGLINDKYKIVFPFRDADYFHYSVFDHADRIPLKSVRQHIVESSESRLQAFSEASTRFLVH